MTVAQRFPGCEHFTLILTRGRESWPREGARDKSLCVKLQISWRARLRKGVEGVLARKSNLDARSDQKREISTANAIRIPISWRNTGAIGFCSRELLRQGLISAFPIPELPTQVKKNVFWGLTNHNAAERTWLLQEMFRDSQKHTHTAREIDK